MTAESPTHCVVDQVRRCLSCRLEEIPRLCVVVNILLVERAMHLVGAALQLHRHRRATREALLRIRAVGYDVDALDCFRRRNEGRVLLNPGVGRAHTFDANVRPLCSRTVRRKLH